VPLSKTSERLVVVRPQRMEAIASARLKHDKVGSETLALRAEGPG
jgi:hypothetical protein